MSTIWTHWSCSSEVRIRCWTLCLSVIEHRTDRRSSAIIFFRIKAIQHRKYQNWNTIEAINQWNLPLKVMQSVLVIKYRLQTDQMPTLLHSCAVGCLSDQLKGRNSAFYRITVQLWHRQKHAFEVTNIFFTFCSVKWLFEFLYLWKICVINFL